MLHFITLSSDRARGLQAALHLFEHEFGLAFDRRGRISPVSGSNGGKPETKTMLPARVTGDPGAPHFSRKDEIGSTRRASVS